MLRHPVTCPAHRHARDAWYSKKVRIRIALPGDQFKANCTYCTVGICMVTHMHPEYHVTALLHKHIFPSNRSRNSASCYGVRTLQLLPTERQW